MKDLRSDHRKEKRKALDNIQVLMPRRDIEQQTLLRRIVQSIRQAKLVILLRNWFCKQDFFFFTCLKRRTDDIEGWSDRQKEKKMIADYLIKIIIIMCSNIYSISKSVSVCVTGTLFIQHISLQVNSMCFSLKRQQIMNTELMYITHIANHILPAMYLLDLTILMSVFCLFQLIIQAYWRHEGLIVKTQ